MFVDYKREIEQRGFRVIATTSYDNGTMSYHAHKVIGRRKLVKGDPMPTPELAMISLLTRCELQ